MDSFKLQLAGANVAGACEPKRMLPALAEETRARAAQRAAPARIASPHEPPFRHFLQRIV
jgi:hypothetical protein